MNIENATDFLNRINWKTLVEWLTAEIILNRPTDPLQFTRDLIGSKLSQRGSTEYRPEQITDWLRNCYTEATALVDENGVIHGKSVDSAQQTFAEKIIELERKIEGMQKLIDASRTIATLDSFQATENIITQTCRILDCDRATIFTLDDVTQELVLTVAEGARDIRVPIGQGIAGTVAQTGDAINIIDAYLDPRFNSSADKASGYKTVTILCMPIKSADGKVAGVLQAINKRDNVFNTTDEEVMGLLAMQAGIALQNANLFRNAEKARDKFRSLLDIIRAMQGELGVNSLIFTITQRTLRVVDADRCTLYLVDNVQKALYAMQGEVNIRISMDQGIAGLVATTGKTLNIPDAYENQAFNQSVDKKTGYRTKAILCLPIKSEDQVIGVLQLINKISISSVFTSDDEDIMMIFLSIAGPILASSKLYQQLQGKGKSRDDRDNELPRGQVKSPVSATESPRKSMPKFTEDDEEDD